MTLQHIATALERAESVLRRRPDMAVHEDTTATSRWEGGLRCISSHPNGTEIATDVDREIGGTGDEVSPGWLMRAGIASCAASSLVMRAAAAGIELTSLEVIVRSHSDTRGLLGIAAADGAAIDPAPREIELVFRLAARDASHERLEALVAESQRCAPVPAAVLHGVPARVRVEIEPA